MAKNSKSSLATLAPKAVVLSIDGQDVRVASNKEENTILNMVLASQLRSLLQENIKRYKDMDTHMTPKEIKDLTESAANIAKFSGEVYSSGEALDDSETNGEKNVTGSDSIETISFDKLKPNGNKDVQPDKPADS